MDMPGAAGGGLSVSPPISNPQPYSNDDSCCCGPVRGAQPQDWGAETSGELVCLQDVLGVFLLSGFLPFEVYFFGLKISGCPYLSVEFQRLL